MHRYAVIESISREQMVRDSRIGMIAKAFRGELIGIRAL